MSIDLTNPESIKRMKLAKSIGPLLGNSDPNIEGVRVFGSTSNDTSKENSDLDLAVIYSQVPPDRSLKRKQLSAMVEQSGLATKKVHIQVYAAMELREGVEVDLGFDPRGIMEGVRKGDTVYTKPGLARKLLNNAVARIKSISTVTTRKTS